MRAGFIGLHFIYQKEIEMKGIIRLKKTKIGDKIVFFPLGEEVWTVTQNTPTYTPPYSPESITIILKNKTGECKFGNPNRIVCRVR